jgi:hypothetical protein
MACPCSRTSPGAVTATTLKERERERARERERERERESKRERVREMRWTRGDGPEAWFK